MVCTEKEEPGTPPTISRTTQILYLATAVSQKYTLVHKHLLCTIQGTWAFFPNPKLNSYLLCMRDKKRDTQFKKIFNISSSLFLLSCWVKWKLCDLVKMPIRILARKEYWHIDWVTQCSYINEKFSSFNPSPKMRILLSRLPPSIRRKETTEGGKQKTHTG